jgi:hypothetical protein
VRGRTPACTTTTLATRGPSMWGPDWRIAPICLKSSTCAGVLGPTPLPRPLTCVIVGGKGWSSVCVSVYVCVLSRQREREKCVCVRACVCVCMRWKDMPSCPCVYLLIYVCMLVRLTLMHVCISMRACVCLAVSVCTYVHVCVYMTAIKTCICVSTKCVFA